MLGKILVYLGDFGSDLGPFKGFGARFWPIAEVLGHIWLMSDAELSVTYTWSRALLQLTMQLTNPYLTILTHHNNPYHNAFSMGSLISLHSICTLYQIIPRYHYRHESYILCNDINEPNENALW